MRNVINYYYNFDIYNLRKIKDNYFLNFKNNLYLFWKVDYKIDISYVQELLKSIQFIPEFHTIILNRDNQILTFDGNDYYVLLKINIKYNKIVSIDDLLKLNSVNVLSKQIGKFSKFNWIELWSKKIDYLEYYMDTKDNIDDNIKSIFNYFIGLGENAINYIKKTFEDERATESDSLTLCHNRITINYTLYDLYNPLNIIVDHMSRDVAEYLKSLFYTRKYNLHKIEYIIKKANLSNFGSRLLLGRIIFPTFFFDLLDDYEINNFSSDEIIDVYNRTSEYEKFIFMVYSTITNNKKNAIPNVYWLNK
ncbi:MAG: hypothetical protein ACI4OG_02040 [Bacilli bacterium]